MQIEILFIILISDSIKVWFVWSILIKIHELVLSDGIVAFSLGFYFSKIFSCWGTNTLMSTSRGFFFLQNKDLNDFKRACAFCHLHLFYQARLMARLFCVIRKYFLVTQLQLRYIINKTKWILLS